MDKSAMVGEVSHAIREGWKTITETDVEEVVHKEIPSYPFSMWMFHALDDKQREDFPHVLTQLKKEQQYDVLPAEKNK